MSNHHLVATFRIAAPVQIIEYFYNSKRDKIGLSLRKQETNPVS
jgi:hypothetical protein